MGIKGFTKILTKYAPAAVILRKYSYYKNKTFGIDANLFLYQLIFAIRRNGYDIKNEGIKVTHIFSLLVKLISFRTNNIHPIFVFDGKPPQIKTKELKRRNTVRSTLIEKYKKDKSNEGKRKLYYVSSKITNDEIAQCKELIEIFGYTFIDAIEEADAQLAYMSKNKSIDYVVTNDYDVLLFGAKNMLKGFTIDNKKYIVEINLDILLKIMKINYSQLIYLGILLGCDYVVGNFVNKPTSPTKAIIKIKEKMPAEDIDRYQQIIEHYKKPKVSNIINKIKSELNKESLTDFLKKFKYSDSYINKIMEKLNI